MKIFEKDGKINFVDSNNVLVGFDYSASCCEDFGWHIGPAIKAENFDDAENTDNDLEGYKFDPTFAQRANTGDDSGGEVAFRLMKEGSPDKYLTLWNHHNGYYDHGFSMEQYDHRLFVGDL